jgi:hypothetical protein
MIETVIMKRKKNTAFEVVSETQCLPYPTVDYWIGVLRCEDNINLRRVAVLFDMRLTVYQVEGTSTYFGVREI